MNFTDSKTQHHRRTRKGGKAARPTVWRPQQTGLTREEIRRIVRDAIG